MHMKQLSAAALALTLILSGVPARAAAVTSVAPRYNGVITLDGAEIESVTYSKPVEGSWETVDEVIPTGDLPQAPQGYIPMRLLCQATETGAAYWYEEDNESMFFLNNQQIVTDFDDNSVYLQGFENDELVRTIQEGVKCVLLEGITYLPASFLTTLDGVTVNTRSEGGKEYFDVTIDLPGTPLQKLADSIRKQLGMGMGGDPMEFFTIMETDMSAFEEVAGQVAMIMIRCDSLIIGKYAPGADKASGKAALKSFQEMQIANFEHYLPKPYEMAKNGKIVESKDGNYVMLVMSEDNDTAIRLFEEGVAALGKGR